MIKSNKYNSGFTFIELMIGVVLSGLFIAGITQVFSHTAQNFRMQKNLSNMMEDARFALDKINSEFRRTGFLSNKLLPDWDSSNVFHNGIAIDYSAGVYTIRNNGVVTPGNLLTMESSAAIHGAVNPAVPVSDNVIIRYQLTQNSAGVVDFTNTYSPCTSGFTQNGGSNTDRQVISIVFYMGEGTTVASNVLYCRAFKENLDTPSANQLLESVPLISNVERLRILYGETDGIGIVYRTSDQVTDWTQVKLARISLVLHSEESNLSVTTPENYIINGQLSIAPNNASQKRLYRVFSTTVAFRNHN